jgi:hypothetical protein
MTKYTQFASHLSKPVDVAADKTVEHEQGRMVDLQTHFVPQN